jgi:hypothetical protein
MAAELGDAGGAQDQREQDGADRGDEQREGERGVGGHPQEGDLDAAGVLNQENDQCDGDEGGDADAYPGRAGASPGNRPAGFRSGFNIVSRTSAMEERHERNPSFEFTGVAGTSKNGNVIVSG